MSNKRINKAYVRYDGSGRVIPGSLILNRFKPKVGNWSEIPAYECCNDTTTTATPFLRLLFDNITNVPVEDPSSVSDWNNFFDLPTNGTPFTSVVVVGNEVQLFGGSNIILGDSLFQYNTYLTTVDDSIGCIVGINNRCFDSCTSLISVNLPELVSANYYSFGNCALLTTINLPKLVTTGTYVFGDCINLESIILPLLETAGGGLFEYCESLTTINMPSCTNLGPTVGDDSVFSTITGNTITLTVPTALMTADGGNPDGDIVYLQANNTVTVVTV